MTTTHERKARSARKSKATKRRGQRGSQGAAAGVVELIDAAFAKLVTIEIGGELRRITTFGAILLKLWIAEMQGNTRAAKVRLRYEAFVRSQRIVPAPEIVVIGGLPRLPDAWR